MHGTGFWLKKQVRRAVWIRIRPVSMAGSVRPASAKLGSAPWSDGQSAMHMFWRAGSSAENQVHARKRSASRVACLRTLVRKKLADAFGLRSSVGQLADASTCTADQLDEFGVGVEASQLLGELLHGVDVMHGS